MKKENDRPLAKKVRIKNEALLRQVRQLPCIACQKQGNGDPHHIKTRGAGGDDVPENLIPLCREHHREWHMKGAIYMAITYRTIHRWLILAGWKLDTEKKEWRRDG